MTTTPIRSETTTVRDSSTKLVVGRSMPKAWNSAFRAAATRKPPPMPMTAPSRPIVNASTRTVVRICGREAPSVRSIPNSLTRWATVIEKVLKIRKEPTKTAMNPKTSRKVWKKPRPSRTSSEPRSAFSWAVSTRTELGSRRSIRRFSACAETPSAAATEIWSKRPRLLLIACATGSVT